MLKEIIKKHKRKLIISIVMIVFLFGCMVKEETEEETVQETTVQETQTESTQPQNEDPFGLSFSDYTYHSESELRNMLSTSELEYCSYIQEFEDHDRAVLTWNLKSSNKEVYRCYYSYLKDRKYGKPSMASCRISEAYQEYLDGDKALIRDYVMPEKDDGIDMFVYPNSAEYYEKYFILGKYSDMYCYVKGDDIFFEYYWYQKSDSGPKLVYKSSAVNTNTTSGQRYDDELWDLFERSYRNIDIIPYKEYPREKDYYAVYSDWKKRQKENKEEEKLKEKKERYCIFEDGEELYYEYEYEFDSYDEAEDFLDRYCD